MRGIYQPSLGYEHIDTAALKENKILFGCLAFDKKFKRTLWSTAEHTLTLILSLIKKFIQPIKELLNLENVLENL